MLLVSTILSQSWLSDHCYLHFRLNTELPVLENCVSTLTSMPHNTSSNTQKLLRYTEARTAEQSLTGEEHILYEEVKL